MKINERTFGRLIDQEPVPQEVKLCVYNLIQVIKNYESYNQTSKGITSESIDGYSVQYAGANKSITEAMEKEENDTINTYLCNVLVNNVPVLFRGIR